MSQHLEDINRSQQAEPDDLERLIQQGALLRQMQKPHQALACYNQVLNFHPTHIESLVHCGDIFYELDNIDFANAHYGFALKLQPTCQPALYGQALCLNRLKKYNEALAVIEQLIKINPDHFPSLLCKASLLHATKQYEAAVKLYEQLTELVHDDPLLYCNLANLHLDLMDLQSAHDYYQRALGLEPQNHNVRWNAALFYLLLGEYKTGWHLYESGKFSQHAPRGKQKTYPQPEWTGELAITGKRILLYAEQGLGDTLQFVRFIPQLLAQGASVILAVPQCLRRLLSYCFPSVEIIDTEEKPQEFDYHCSLLSLPFTLGTELKTIPCLTPYLFAEPEKTVKFEGYAPNALRVGLVWSGSNTHNNDDQRSIPVQLLEPLLHLNASFHCLQNEIRTQDLVALDSLNNIHVYTNDLHDFTDTAALLATMDIVISVDTSVAHLAGAMHKPLCLLLPSPPDFRWLLARDDSPWYPTATLFRNHAQDWTQVIQLVKEHLAAMIPSAHSS